MKKWKILVAAVFAIISSNTNAEAYCYNETVTGVIVQNGGVFFTTNKSCPHWCQIDTSWDPDSKNRALSMLMAARSTGKTLSFHWDELNTVCEKEVPVFATPTNLIY